MSAPTGSPIRNLSRYVLGTPPIESRKEMVDRLFAEEAGRQVLRTHQVQFLTNPEAFWCGIEQARDELLGGSG